MIMPENTTGPILFYDGNCAMCNSLVVWLLDKDLDVPLRYASLEGSTAEAELIHRLPDYKELDTVVLLMEEEAFIRSQAALKLGGFIPGYRLLSKLLAIVPRFIRDAVYKMVARNRQRIWTHCPVIPENQRGKFLP